MKVHATRLGWRRSPATGETGAEVMLIGLRYGTSIASLAKPPEFVEPEGLEALLVPHDLVGHAIHEPPLHARGLALCQRHQLHQWIRERVMDVVPPPVLARLGRMRVRL